MRGHDKQRGLETLRACPKARYKDCLDTAKSDVLADVLRQFGVSGVPFVVRQTESGWAQIALDSLH